MRSITEWKERLRGDLREAMRARRTEVVAVLRETLSALDQAEAAEPSVAPRGQVGPIAGAVSGLGAGDVPRKALSSEEARAVVEREREERRAAAAAYQALGREEEARTLTAQVEVLDALLDTPAG